MIFLLDTNICIYVIKSRPPGVLRKFGEHTVGDIGISSVTAAELYSGAEKSQRPEGNLHALERFLLPLTIVEFADAAAAAYGRIRAILKKRGTPIGPLRRSHSRARRRPGPDAGDQQRP